MKKSFLFRVTICLALLTMCFTFPTPASACSCMMPGLPVESFRDYDAVFSGKVTSITGNHSPAIVLLDRILIRLNLRPTYYYSNAYWGNDVTFTVHQSWKGVSTTEVTIHTGSGGGDCGYSFTPGNDYLVYAYHMDGSSGSGLGASICSRTTELSYATEDLTYLNTLPTWPLTPVSNNTWLYVAGCTLALLIVPGSGIIFWLWRRNRQVAGNRP